MTNLEMKPKKKVAVLNFANRYWFAPFSSAGELNYFKGNPKRRISFKDYWALVASEFAKLEINTSDLLEVINDTELFRNEMDVIEHGYGTATGSNYDKMVVKFRGETYVIDDAYGSIEFYDGENGFS